MQGGSEEYNIIDALAVVSSRCKSLKGMSVRAHSLYIANFIVCILANCNMRLHRSVYLSSSFACNGSQEKTLRIESPLSENSDSRI